MLSRLILKVFMFISFLFLQIYHYQTFFYTTLALEFQEEQETGKTLLCEVMLLFLEI